MGLPEAETEDVEGLGIGQEIVSEGLGYSLGEDLDVADRVAYVCGVHKHDNLAQPPHHKGLLLAHCHRDIEASILPDPHHPIPIKPHLIRPPNQPPINPLKQRHLRFRVDMLFQDSRVETGTETEIVASPFAPRDPGTRTHFVRDEHGRLFHEVVEEAVGGGREEQWEGGAHAVYGGWFGGGGGEGEEEEQAGDEG